MDTLYDRLLALQRLPTAYGEWAAYRAALTDFAVGHTAGDGSLLVVGAGACNDLDLQRLAAHFLTVTLLDRDGAAMDAGLARQGVPPGRIRTVTADLLGVPDGAYREMCDGLLGKLQRQRRLGQADPAALTELFCAAMNAMLENRKPDACAERGLRADTVLCCGVHSQLLSMFPQMAGVYARYAAMDVNRIEDAVRRWNAVIMGELNARLLRMAGSGLILGLEEGRLGMEGGVEGAAEALLDLPRLPAKLVEEAKLLWPLDRSQGKIYSMRLVLLRT